jgi:[protein-PII] uridylyltransferase
LRVLEELEKGEFRGEDRMSRLRRIKTRVESRLAAEHPADRVRSFIEAMPDRYFLGTPEEEMPAHFELVEQFKNQVYVSAVRHLPENEFSEMTVCTTDRPGLFANIAGVLAAMNLDILSARIITRKDGLILDTFRISHMSMAEAVMKPQKWERVQALLEKALAGEIDVARLVVQSDKPSLFKKRVAKVPTSIQIDNSASDEFTIIEVYTQDRIGVLFTITHTLHQLGLSIHVAKISTNVDQVADFFYVADEHGGKIGNAARLEAIRSGLYQALVAEHERIAQPAP